MIIINNHIGFNQIFTSKVLAKDENCLFFFQCVSPFDSSLWPIPIGLFYGWIFFWPVVFMCHADVFYPRPRISMARALLPPRDNSRSQQQKLNSPISSLPLFFFYISPLNAFVKQNVHPCPPQLPSFVSCPLSRELHTEGWGQDFLFGKMTMISEGSHNL